MTQNIFVGIMFAAVIVVSVLVWWYENRASAKDGDIQGEAEKGASLKETESAE